MYISHKVPKNISKWEEQTTWQWFKLLSYWRGTNWSGIMKIFNILGETLILKCYCTDFALWSEISTLIVDYLNMYLFEKKEMCSRCYNDSWWCFGDAKDNYFICLIICMLGNFPCFIVICWIFLKKSLFSKKKSFKNTSRVLNIRIQIRTDIRR